MAFPIWVRQLTRSKERPPQRTDPSPRPAMPLFRVSGELSGRPGQRQFRGSRGKAGEDGSVFSLTRLCLLSLADNLHVWVKDYADNYLDRYSFRYIMGPFSLLPGELVEELTRLLAARKQLSRAALHLLLVPQLRVLSLEKCPGLVTSALCPHIAARCQGLRSLDLSGAQQLPSKVLSETLCCLPDLRSLSLAGTPCDRCVIRAIAHCCRSLRHLDVSRCHFLSPAALLLLAAGASFSPSGHPSGTPRSFISPSSSAPLSPPPLSSLLALDIGFGEQEGEPVAVAAHLLLSLPCLERVAVDGLAQACRLLQKRAFHQTDELADRVGVPRLGEVWREWRSRQSVDTRRKNRDASAADEEVEGEERILWEEHSSESEEGASRDEGGSSCTQKQAEEQRRGRAQSESGDERFILRLKDVKGLSCDSLHSLGCLCPDIDSISVNVDDEDARGRNQGLLLAGGLQVWSGQLRSLSVHYPGPLVDLLPAFEVAGSSLLSLTLEGVKTCPQTPLEEVIKTCPRLRELLISAEPPTTSPQGEEDEEDQRDERDLPRLPDLGRLTLKFSYEHSKMKPVMSWMSLRRVLWCLLTGSPSLERISLVSPPCSVNSVLQDALRSVHAADIPPMPLAQVQRIELPRTDVKTGTVKSIMQRSKRLKYVDVRNCWQIRRTQWLDCKAFSKAEVVWS